MRLPLMSVSLRLDRKAYWFSRLQSHGSIQINHLSMTTFAIDTHKTINKLVERGFSQKQAEGLVEALTESALVTKDDLRIVIAEQTSSIVKWVAALLLAQAGLVTALQNLI